MCPLSYFLRIMPLFLALLASAQAQNLQWESEELKFSPAPTDATVVAHFKFKNIGEAKAKIKGVNSSCDCTKVTLEKYDFAPGESGDVVATFTIGVRTGIQDKVLLVESNDVTKPRIALRMKIAIPEVAQLRPSFLFWSQTEPFTPKEISLEVMNGVPVKAITVESSDPKVMAKVESVKRGQEYRIVVTPSETDQQIMAMLSIKTDYPPGNPKIFYANVRVQPKK